MNERAREPAIVIILGASGDLTQRKLGPALHSLACAGLLSDETRVVGLARSPLSDEAFRERLYEGVLDYARLKPGETSVSEVPLMCKMWPNFAQRFSYVPGSYDDPDAYRRLGEHLAKLSAEAGIPSNHLFYLATPPTLYPIIVEQLGMAGLNRNGQGWTRIIIEKPFGRDLQSAQDLNTRVHAVFAEEQVYRIDHYLGKETVQNLLAFRFANAIFEPLWTRNYVKDVQITVSETVGVEHRAQYYEHAGVLRDMLQNHLLQLLTLTAMEPPVAFDDRSLRDEKVKVLQAVRAIAPSDAVRAQYQGYLQEPEVAPDSRTPTYVALQLFVDNWRWKGVPFFLRTGKSLGRKLSEITLSFREVPHLLFPENANLTPNSLSFAIQPDEGIHLRFGTKVPGAGMRVAPVDMSFRYGAKFGERVLPEAYERLLLDAIQGDASLFARSDEIERAWMLLSPLLAQEQETGWPLASYAPGSGGPVEAEVLLGRHGCNWQEGCAVGDGVGK